MQNTCVSSTLAVRCKGSLLYPFNDYTYCSNDRFCWHPFPYTSPLLLQSPSLTCCACCASKNSLVYRTPVGPSYLYGLRQTSLIQWAPCKKVILGGLDSVYGRLPGCSVDRSCYRERGCKFRDRDVYGRRGKWGRRRYRCMVSEENSERCSLDDANEEVEVMLSLLTEEVSEELFDVRGRNESLIKKVVVEKRGNGGGSSAGYSGKKKNVGSGGLENSSKFEYESKIIESRLDDKRRKEETRGEKREALERRPGQSVSSREERREEFLRENRKARSRKEEREESLKDSRNELVREERREDTLRVNGKVSARDEEREDLLRAETHRQRLRKDGSSCSSYYSLSSTGEFESETESHFKEEGELEEESRKYRRDFGGHAEVKFEGEVDEGVRRQGCKSEEQGLVLRKKNTAIGSESSWRKKSEKKLVDTSAEEARSQRELSRKQAYISDIGDSYGKTSYKKDDGHEEQMTSTVKYDEGSKRQYLKSSDEITHQSEQWMKHKRSMELPESHSASYVTTSGSQKATSSDHEARQGHYDRPDHTATEEEYRRKSQKSSEYSNTQEIDISKTSTSQVGSASTRKFQGKTTTVIQSSTHDAEEKQYQTGQFNRQEYSSQTSQQFGKEFDAKEGKRIGDSSMLAYGSYQESREHNFQKYEDETGKLESGTGVGARTTSHHYSGTLTTDEGSRRKSEAAVTPLSSQLVSRGESHTGRLSIEEVSHGSSSNAAAGSYVPIHETPLVLPQESLGGTRRGETIEQPLAFPTREDTLGSADRLQKTSTHYVGEFVKNVRHEVSSSETCGEKKIYHETVVHDREQEEKALIPYVSGDPKMKKHGSLSRHTSPGSGSKGPSDEMWHVTEPSKQATPEAEVPGETSSTSSVITRRSGRSMWNIIGDIVRLRWTSRSTDHSAAGKSGGRSSPNQSTNTEAWFSGHEPDEGIHEHEASQRRNRPQEYVDFSPQEEAKIRYGSQGESSILSSSKDNIMPVDGSSHSYAEVVAQGTASGSIYLPSGEETYESHTGDNVSGAAMEGPIVSPPAIRLRRSPAVVRASEIGVVNAPTGVETKQSDLLISTFGSDTSQIQAKGRELKQGKLQRTNQVMKDRFDEWEEAYRIDMEQRKVDEKFMREALLEAKQAADNWEVPVGAVLVHDGQIIARGYNLVEELRDSTAHAEMICIREASKILRTWRLSETTLYVTLEPCPMCAGAILQSRIDTVVWGAPNKLLGADGSWIRLFPSGEGASSMDPPDKPPAPVHPFHPKIKIRRNVLESECAQVMQQFFQRRRKKKEKEDPPTPPASCLPISSHPSKFFTKMHDAFHIMFCL